jgi:plastocyanin
VRRSFVTFALLTALALVAAACGGGKKATGFPSPGATPPASPTATATATGGATQSPPAASRVELVTGNLFEPATITVPVGTTVTWDDVEPDQPHTVTADDGSFDSHPDCKTFADKPKCMNKGDTFTFTFEKAGTVQYYCRTHGAPGGQGMAGKVVVQ